jgi:nitrogen-specific signal transduction histidine kinase
VSAVLLVALPDGRRDGLQRALAKHSVFVVPTDTEALALARQVDLDLVVRVTDHALGELTATLRQVAPRAVVVALGSPDEAPAADFALRPDFSGDELERLLAQVGERQRLVREIDALRSRLAGVAPAAPGTAEPRRGTRVPGRALREFTRAFAAGFDTPRMLSMFLDAVAELVRPSRSALLLVDPRTGLLHVSAHQGLAPRIVDSVQLDPTGPLADWLTRQARPACLGDGLEPPVAREVGLLQAVLVVPLLARAELIGMLALGQPVVRAGYEPDEVETLLDLAAHLATTLRDAALHHELAGRKEFSEQILAHMSSGVITIGRDERFALINRRAEEVLGLPPGETLHQDLRALPSPLGDLLFDALRSGRSMPRTEIRLALGGLWLEVSTYPVHGDGSVPVGAVLVLEDVTAQKALAAQRREADELQLLTRVVARIADEIKNPLVSINTFVELVEERFDDPDFRKHFAVVVRRDVRRVAQVFEKLAGLVSGGELHWATVDARAVVDEVVTAMQLGDEDPGRSVEVNVAGDPVPQPLRTDPVQLRKALSYLGLYLADNSPPGRAQVTISVDRHVERDGAAAVRVLLGSRTAQVPPDRLERLFDPVQMVQEGVIQAGPAVSQRIVEALGGSLRLRHGRHELGFLVSLPAASS